MLIDTKPELQFQLQLYAKAWQDKPKEQVVEEISSVCAETKCVETTRVPDYYQFLIKDGFLIDPQTNRPIKEFIRRYSPLGKMEGQAFDATEQWVNTQDQGVSFWISPPVPGKYPGTKIIIQEIEYLDGQKVLTNRAILLDFDEETCLSFTQKLAQYCSNKPLLFSVDEIRKTPLIFSGSPAYWTYLLEELVPDLSLEGVRLGEDIKSKQADLVQTQQIYEENISSQTGEVNIEGVFLEVRRRGMIGDGNPSCPPEIFTAFEYVFGHSLITESSCKKIKCGNQNCGWEPKDDEVQKIKEGKITCCPDCGWKPG